MKKIRMIQIIELIILVLVAVALISFLSHVSKNSTRRSNQIGSNFDFGFEWGNVGDGIVKKIKEEQVSSAGIDKIALDFDSADIEVSVTDEETIKIIESSSKPLRDKEVFNLVNKNGTLRVTKGQRMPRIFFFGFGGQQHKIELFIPKGYKGDLDINTSSGDIRALSELKLNNISMHQASGDLQIDYAVEVQSFSGDLASGDVDIKFLDCKEYTIHTASGDIDTDYLKGSGEIEASSGNIEIDELIGGQYNIHSSSGDIKLKGIAGSGEISAASGDIEAEYAGIEAYASLNAASGDITLKLAENISLEMDAKCVSGDIEGNIDIDYKNKKGSEAAAIIGQGPYAKLKVNTMSGDITVNKN